MMKGATDLNRFIEAQQRDYANALAEIKNGRKRSHWMWYIFPQVQGLGFTETSKYYAIKDIAEAEDFMDHPVLSSRLISISNVLLTLKTNNATEVFGNPDDMKLRSSMTLFAATPGADPVFQLVLDKFFGGIGDDRTLSTLKHL